MIKTNPRDKILLPEGLDKRELFSAFAMHAIITALHGSISNKKVEDRIRTSATKYADRLIKSLDK